ncbi:hypothetical protein B0H10DRAFT_1817689, partial [Mycena sp. CBHHK59/15]
SSLHSTTAPMDAEPTLDERSTDVWFEDGTVVLKAARTLFRVYRGILSAQSPIFHDTFSIPQPTTQEMYDGCPVVVLHDFPNDLRVFLAATHNPGYLKTSPVDGIDTLSALLRLSTKYEVDYLRNDMLSILTSIYPSSVEAWLERNSPPGYSEIDDHDFKALNLARELQILQILPGVFFECCRHSVGSIFNAEIDATDKEKCLAAREDFVHEYCPLVYRFLYCRDDNSVCVDPSSCDAARLAWLTNNKSLAAIDDVFCGDFEWDDIMFCGLCIASAQGGFLAARQALWDNLPRIFGLPAWNTL